MSAQRRGILSEEETERLIEVIGTLRRVQQVAANCLEAIEELAEQAAEIGRRHEVPAFSAPPRLM